MENLKDVIVSQPPAMYSQAAYTTSISLENYKGILLCDRPTGLGGSTAGGGSEGSCVNGKSFSPSNPTGNPVGLGPSVESQAQREQREALRQENFKKRRAQSNQALSRHRRWLRSFAQQVKQMQSDERERVVERAHQAARLREAESQRRLELKEQQHQPQAVHRNCSDCGHCQPSQPIAEQQQRQPRGERKAAAGSKKPKWAMTEDEALDDELAMNDDLLNFASSLDYDRFVSDYEVAEALTVMRDRVCDIARANDWSDADLLRAAAAHDADDDLASTIAPSERDAAQRPVPVAAAAAEARAALPGGAAQHDKDWDASRGRVLKRAISRDALALAERLLAASPSMQKVYTKQSLARVLQRCALQGDTGVSEAALLAMARSNLCGRCDEKKQQPAPNVDSVAGEDLAAATAIGPQQVEPRVVQVNAYATPGVTSADPYDQPRVLREMQISKERTQGLPYLYRCPAI